MKFIQTYDNKDGFKHEIEVENFDTWNADNTMSIVIYAVMKRYGELRDTGGCMLDIEDIPPHIQCKETYGCQEGKTFCSEAFYWIVDEIVWATNPLRIDSDSTEHGETERERNAMRLFGKYFYGFWN